MEPERSIVFGWSLKLTHKSSSRQRTAEKRFAKLFKQAPNHLVDQLVTGLSARVKLHLVTHLGTNILEFLSTTITGNDEILCIPSRGWWRRSYASSGGASRPSSTSARARRSAYRKCTAHTPSTIMPLTSCWRSCRAPKRDWTPIRHDPSSSPPTRQPRSGLPTAANTSALLIWTVCRTVCSFLFADERDRHTSRHSWSRYLNRRRRTQAS